MENEELLNKLLDQLKTLSQTQNEISTTLKVLVRQEIEKRLSHIFEDNEEILIYQLSDGKTPTSEISKHVAASTATISRLWQKWEENYGIVETAGYRNPYRAKYSLEELVLLFGRLPKTDSAQPENEE